MQSISSKLQTYVRPLGFILIIILMISTTFLTSVRVKDTAKTIVRNELHTNNVNRALNIMSNAILQRSHLFVNMINNTEPLIIKRYLEDLNHEAERFESARDSLQRHVLSEKESSLLAMQYELTTANTNSINEIIKHFNENEFEQASQTLNTKILIRSKQILNITNQLHEVAHDTAFLKSVQTEKISDETYKSIIGSNFVSILITVLMMLYLSRKQRKSDSDLSFLANTDTLTKLPNRSNFITNINHAINNEKQCCFAIIFFDIDYFKSINDNYSHEIGDIVLRYFSKAIASAISPDDILSRFGGDEFVLLLKNVSTEQAEDFVKQLRIDLDTSFHIGSNVISVSASIGASHYPTDGNTAKVLLKNADIAMYSAKESGRNCHQFFSQTNSERLECEHSLSHALQTVLKSDNKDNQLSLVYHPLVNIIDNNFNECEALIRWHDINGNNINTAEFIEISEKSNLIQKVNEFVIKEACKQQQLWQKEGIENIRININLSGNKRIFDELFRCLLDSLGKYNLKAEQFGIELTERTMYEISDETIEDLSHFRDLGMKIAIDDFGTGYSSLSYLKDLPITSIKIDKSFIDGLPHSKVDIALVKAIITLAHSLEFDVVAEGVETQEQFDFLNTWNCNIAQGYLLHRPLKSQEISKLKLAA
ncbi:MAG: diguanylate cyclase (GGDEF)-like protein [Cocleimonas sp.]|jgi:diguanylate cyclase (GGDEF)-like protein